MCRLVKFDFAKEIGTHVVEEIPNKIEKLLPSSLTINDSNIGRTVSHTEFKLLSFTSASKDT